MAEILDLSDPEFTAQMQGLVEQAQQAIDDRAAASRQSDLDRAAMKEAEERALNAYRSLPDSLRPLVNGIEEISRATAENTQALTRIEGATEGAAKSLQTLPGIVAELNALVERKDQLSRQMFDALHEELRSYKDGFLLDSVHRPVIRDLITLFDDLTEIHRLMVGAAEDRPTDDIPNRLKPIEVHLSHNLDFVLEVLARFEVTRIPAGGGKLDKKTQRAVAVESTEEPNEDLDIARIVRCGFLWKDRIVRPEEVIIKKWKDGFLVALQQEK
jgi:molecular chaperone GrpE (heat shock protein)